MSWTVLNTLNIKKKTFNVFTEMFSTNWVIPPSKWDENEKKEGV